MPELPEVETIVRGLRRTLPGKTLTRARLTAPDLYHKRSRRVQWLRGRTVRAVERFGKAILLRFDGDPGGPDLVMVIHLGMSGSVRAGDGAYWQGQTRARNRDAKHTHGRFAFSEDTVMEYHDPRRFGFFYVGEDVDLGDVLNIGPDPFEMTPRRLAEILRGRTAPIKSLLLNQKLIAGVGNIYADEALFAAQIHPLSPGGRTVRVAPELLAAVRATMRNAITYGGTTLRNYRKADGSRGAYKRRLAVYAREGEPCYGCGRPVRKIVLGGRGTHYCPRCQKRKR